MIGPHLKREEPLLLAYWQLLQLHFQLGNSREIIGISNIWNGSSLILSEGRIYIIRVYLLTEKVLSLWLKLHLSSLLSHQQKWTIYVLLWFKTLSLLQELSIIILKDLLVTKSVCLTLHQKWKVDPIWLCSEFCVSFTHFEWKQITWIHSSCYRPTASVE